MKKIITYSILAAVLFVGSAALSAAVWEGGLRLQVIAGDAASAHGDDGCFFTDFDRFIVPAGTARLDSPRLQRTSAKTGDNLYSSLADYFSLLAARQLYTTKSIYFSFYAEKQLWGFYLFALCKLLI